MATEVKTLNQLLADSSEKPSSEWCLRAVQSEECLSYVAWNEKTKEALLVDPKDEDVGAYRSLFKELKDYRWIAIIDTHTHADHISIAATLADEFNTPLVMHAGALTKKVHIRISKTTRLMTQAGPLDLVITPGHTPDSITPIWGPFIFGGDTLLYGDTGRDDLPGGSPESHYDSLQELKKHAKPEMIVLPGHDNKGGRASSWKKQMEVNSSLTQGREDFIRESAAFDAPAPKLLKKSLRENFK
ncbi:MAG: hypothetical protein AB7F43_11600 [Bacteriovoracia bacterium]